MVMHVYGDVLVDSGELGAFRGVWLESLFGLVALLGLDLSSNAITDRCTSKTRHNSRKPNTCPLSQNVRDQVLASKTALSNWVSFQNSHLYYGGIGPGTAHKCMRSSLSSSRSHHRPSRIRCPTGHRCRFVQNEALWKKISGYRAQAKQPTNYCPSLTYTWF